MFKRRWAFLGVLLLVVASVLAAREPSPPYEMEIRHTDKGIALQCKRGCDWISLTGSCEDSQRRCTYVVDQRGIRVLPPGVASAPGAAAPKP